MGVLKRIVAALFNNGMANVAASVEMLASQQAYGNLGAALPDNQWVREIDHFLATTLVAAQYQISRYAGGAGFPTPSQNIQSPSTIDSWMCSHQVIQRDDFTSFRMIGVIIILVVGGLMIILDTVLHPIVRWLGRKRKASKSSNLLGDHDWRHSSVFHNQAYAYSLLGYGRSWEMDGLVPTTKDEHRFGPVWKTVEDLISMPASSTQSDLENGMTSENLTLAGSPDLEIKKVTADEHVTSAEHDSN